MRKKQSKKRDLIPDPKFNDQLVTRFVNNLMQQGKKSTAYKIFYDAIDIIENKKEDKEKTSIQLWKDALSNVMPQVEVRSRRVGGATFQIPKGEEDKDLWVINNIGPNIPNFWNMSLEDRQKLACTSEILNLGDTKMCEERIAKIEAETAKTKEVITRVADEEGARAAEKEKVNKPQKSPWFVFNNPHPF